MMVFRVKVAFGGFVVTKEELIDQLVKAYGFTYEELEPLSYRQLKDMAFAIYYGADPKILLKQVVQKWPRAQGGWS